MAHQLATSRRLQKRKKLPKRGTLRALTAGIRVHKYQETNVPGVYAAGNSVKDVQLAIVAATEGAKAAFGINKSLNKDFLQTYK